MVNLEQTVNPLDARHFEKGIDSGFSFFLIRTFLRDKNQIFFELSLKGQRKQSD